MYRFIKLPGNKLQEEFNIDNADSPIVIVLHQTHSRNDRESRANVRYNWVQVSKELAAQ